MKQKQARGHGEQTGDCQGGGVMGRNGLGIWDQRMQTLYMECVTIESYCRAQETLLNTLMIHMEKHSLKRVDTCVMYN